MKTVKFTLMFLACSAALPALAQSSSPQCGLTNYDQSRGYFTVINPSAAAVNQQCFLTVIPAGTSADQARQHPAPYLVEGTYNVALSGGGGGGGGGASRDRNSDRPGGDGGSGASAAVSNTTQYLSPGIYRLTIGTGGDGGRANGGTTEDGNPTSLTNAHTGQLIAGFPGAEGWRQGSVAAGTGRGGIAQAGASSGQDGQIAAGGASGHGGTNTQGRMHSERAQDGGRGGDGFIRLALQTAAAPARTGAVAQQATTQAATSPAPAPAVLPMKRDRN